MLGYLVGLGSYGVYAWLLLGYNSFLGYVEPLLVDPLLGTSAEFLQTSEHVLREVLKVAG